MTDGDTGQSKGYGFITVSTDDSQNHRYISSCPTVGAPFHARCDPDGSVRHSHVTAQDDSAELSHGLSVKR